MQIGLLKFDTAFMIKKHYNKKTHFLFRKRGDNIFIFIFYTTCQLEKIIIIFTNQHFIKLMCI